MKILCLHGQGTSGAIFKSQTGEYKPPFHIWEMSNTIFALCARHLTIPIHNSAAFRAKLPPSYTFDFVDAPFPCAPAPGIDVLFASAGTYTWWPTPSVSLIRGSHRRLLDHLAEGGPYDALCCFSQGCSLALSFLLYHARESGSQEPLPFRSVVFICGGVPFPVLEDLGVGVSERAREVSDATVRVMKEKAGRLAWAAGNLGEVRLGRTPGLWDDTSDLVHDPAVMPEEGGDVFGIDFGEVGEELRVGIPTVHIYGAKDPRWPSSMQLACFCRDRKMFDHGGGHDIPRSTEVSERIAELIRGLPGGG